MARLFADGAFSKAPLANKLQICERCLFDAFPSLETHATTANTRGPKFSIPCGIEEIWILKEANMASEFRRFQIFLD